jgi:hypothetical protein
LRLRSAADPGRRIERAIRADGKAVEANLRGFRAGLEAAQASAARRVPESRKRSAAASLADLEREIMAVMSTAARDMIQEGARRLVTYQDIEYAQLYIDRLAPIRLVDEAAGAEGRLLREVGRHLAVRMSYEDAIRVAQAKIDPSRRARIAAEMGAKPGEPLHITEFLKPGIDEICSVATASRAGCARSESAAGRFSGMRVSSQASRLPAAVVDHEARPRRPRLIASRRAARYRGLARPDHRPLSCREPRARITECAG